MSSTTSANPAIDAETKEMLLSFVSESLDSLDTSEPIVEYLRSQDNSDSVNAIFRVFHTMKGVSGFFEMHVINRVTHQAETLLDIIRKQNLVQSEETLTVIYQLYDFLRDLLHRVSVEMTDFSAAEEAEDMILIVRDAIGKVAGQSDGVDLAGDLSDLPDHEPEMPGPEVEIHEAVEESAAEVTEVEFAGADAPIEELDLDKLVSNEMVIQYLSSANDLLDIAEKNLLELEKDPQNMPIIGETFGSVHSLKGNSGFMGYAEIEEISIDMETILDCFRSKSLEPDSNIITILLSNIEMIRTRLNKIAALEDEKQKENPFGDEKIEIDFDRQTQAPKPAAVKPDTAPEGGMPLNGTKAVEEKAAVKPGNPASPPPAMQQKKDIRVETTKIDKLFDLVGELITIETMVTNNPDLKGHDLPNFNKSAGMLNKITRELQEISMSIRMMPLDGQFNKMKRLVRDVSIKMNRKVNFLISGQETEMDKNVIDEIADPLVHLLRNAIDHGIESPEDRLAKGKPEMGTISLAARYEGNEILITVEDDGGGINRNVVLKKAEEKGLLKYPPDAMSDRQVFALLFEPGFSTAKEITDISGRGVGMDVVKKNIEKLRGSIDVNSTLGKGTRVTLRIPLTLAIMEAMLIRIGKAEYALPLLSIKESFKPKNNSITVTMDGLEVVKVREEILPVIRLHELFGTKPDSHSLEDGILTIVEARERKVCLFTDEIVGQQQAVIKGLSNYIGKVPGITGCMILGDGGIGLIIDIEGIIDMAQR